MTDPYIIEMIHKALRRLRQKGVKGIQLKNDKYTIYAAHLPEFRILKTPIPYTGPFTRGIIRIRVDLEKGTYELLTKDKCPCRKLDSLLNILDRKGPNPVIQRKISKLLREHFVLVRKFTRFINPQDPSSVETVCVYRCKHCGKLIELVS